MRCIHTFILVASCVGLFLVGCSKTNSTDYYSSTKDTNKIVNPVTLPTGVFTSYGSTSDSWLISMHTGVVTPAPYFLEEYNNIAVDASGNTFILFNPTGVVDLDPGTGTSLKPQGPVCLVKYDINGKFVWRKLFASTTYINGQAITTDPNGNIEMAFLIPTHGTLSTDDLIYTIKGTGASTCLVTVDSNGKNIGLNEIGTSSTGNVTVTSLIMDAAGNLYVAGASTDSGSLKFFGTTVALTSQLSPSIYIAKYNSAGVYQWCSQLPTLQVYSGSVYFPPVMAVDKSQNIFVSGYITAYTNPSIKFLGDNISGGGHFIGKFNNAGTPIWIKGYGQSDPNFELCTSMVADANGDVYTAGNIYSYPYANNVRKVSANGVDVWKSTTPTILQYYTNDRLAVNSKGEILSVVNYTTDPTKFFGYGINIKRYSASGSTLWNKKITGYSIAVGQAFMSGIAYDSRDNIHIIGDFENAFKFFNTSADPSVPPSDFSTWYFVGTFPDH